MMFVSYAQNNEDVLLWRALKHIKNGTYIDVGANDPKIDSVTKAFYERGWSGINIEPLPSHHKDLLFARPRDINIQCAAGETTGELNLWEYDVRGWATGSLDVLEQHKKNGFEGKKHTVKISTLEDICKQYVFGEIHFLKIDVEGFEKSVIAGANFTRYRPWILAIEATKPNSTEEAFQDWEPLVIDADYVFCYFDGLNRFYVAQEHRELEKYFRTPPCVFDKFIKNEQRQLEISLHQARSWETQTENRLAQTEIRSMQMEELAAKFKEQKQIAEIARDLAEAKLLQAEFRTAHAEAHNNEIINSTSWRLTAPLRAFASILKKIIRVTIRPPLLMIMNFILKRKFLRDQASKVLKQSPGFAHRLHLMAINHGLVDRPVAASTNMHASTEKSPAPEDHLMTPHATRIRDEIKSASGQHTE